MINAPRFILFSTAALTLSVGSACAEPAHPAIQQGLSEFGSRVDCRYDDPRAISDTSQPPQNQFSVRPEGSGQPNGAP